MLVCLAELRNDTQADIRGFRRRKLHLASKATLDSAAHRVLIHDLSENGMMIETTAPFAVGERFDVELPESGNVTVCVVWCDGFRHGCEFDTALTKAAVSAVLLRTPFQPPAHEEFEDQAAFQNSMTYAERLPSVPRTGQMASTSMVLLLVCVIAFATVLASAPFSIG